MTALARSNVTRLFDMRGMSDLSHEGSVLGARSSGYLIRQTVITLEAATRALADGSIDAADTSLWDTLPTQEWNLDEWRADAPAADAPAVVTP